jgi:hypothetical protein
MCWPAFYNGYPLLFPDSMSYIEDGQRVARAVFFHDLSPYYGSRSFIFGMGILPFHWNITAWPIIGLQAALTAYVLWLVAKSVAPAQPLFSYGVVVVALSLATTMPWFVSYVMPDIFGPLLYLCIYLMVFDWDALSSGERAAVLLIGWWSAASHTTHVLIGAAVCVVVFVVCRIQHRSVQQCASAIARPAGVILVAIMAHLALHAYLYGKPSLTGEHAPFVMARLLADGPGRWYLSQHCAGSSLVVCIDADRLPDNVAGFLWAPDGIWRGASQEKQARLRDQEMEVVLGTIRAYPGDVLRLSAKNFWRQLQSFGLWNYDADPWILTMFETVLPAQRAAYLRTRQARQALHEGTFGAVEEGVVLISVLAGAACGVALWRGWSSGLVGLTTIIIVAVIGNAAVTGVLSNVEDRYQSRVVWLVPLLAGVLALVLWNRKRSFHVSAWFGRR